MWVCPLILTPDHPPTFIVRRYDEDSIGLESRAPRVVSYFGEDDAVAVWAETLREMGLERARLGLELDCWGIAPRDVAELQQLLPNLTVVDASRLVGEVMDIKSPAEITVMRRAMELTKVGLAAFSAGLHEGVSEREITRQVDDALTAAGSEPPPFPFTLLLGERTALPHGETGESRLRPGDVAFVEMSGVCQRYCAGLVRTALLGRNPAAEDLYRIAQEAQQAAIDALRPGATTGEVDAACRGVVERAGRGETFRHRTGYSIGLDWQDRGNTSLKPGGQDIIQPGMTFHMPTNLFESPMWPMNSA